ncbi:MAG: DUF3793 family protein [Butyrivibrio sp.]|nr:DUF3793 family protein [Butyrivibrio sp.]
MPENIIVENCSPTLAGLKTGNLFSVDICMLSDIYEELRLLNKTMTDKGLRAIPLKISAKNVLIYIYRPDRLQEDLSCDEARAILMKKGYPCCSIEEDIVHLINHIHEDGSFPHEIGLFLGYPPVDVKGFMDDTRKGVKCVGYWKVYGDQKSAEETFLRYKKCTDIYKKCLANGKCLSQMIVCTKQKALAS